MPHQFNTLLTTTYIEKSLTKQLNTHHQLHQKNAGGFWKHYFEAVALSAMKADILTEFMRKISQAAPYQIDNSRRPFGEIVL